MGGGRGGGRFMYHGVQDFVEHSSDFLCHADQYATHVYHIWNSVQQNHPFIVYQIFQDKQKKSNARIEMYG